MVSFYSNEEPIHEQRNEIVRNDKIFVYFLLHACGESHDLFIEVDKRMGPIFWEVSMSKKHLTVKDALYWWSNLSTEKFLRVIFNAYKEFMNG